MLKKTFMIGIGICGLLGAEDVKITPFGALGGLYNQGLGSSHNYGNLMAHTGVDFALQNGWSFGLGAIGGWNVWNTRFKSTGTYGIPGYGGIGNKGDVSEVYAHYKNSRLEFSLGRFNTNFLDFEYVAGNIQGASAQIKVDEITYWGAFIDSMLWTGVHKNTIASLYGTNIISSYYPLSKKNIFGKWGEVFAVGVGYGGEHLKGSAFSLLDTQLPADMLKNRRGLLFQVGGDVQYRTNFAGEWQSSSILRGIFQLGNTAFLPATSIKAKDAFAGLLWFDQKFRYRIFEFGGGLIGVIGTKDNGGIYTLNDPSRFYGKIINSPTPQNKGVYNFASPYFASHNFTGYIFGRIDLTKNKNLPIRIDGMAAFGTYTEYSIVADYKVWSYNNMNFNAGIGYVFSRLNRSAFPNSAHPSSPVGTSSLILFGKFFY
ncbi:Uncharacterised protein [Helicobacter mustelae]|uniref:hypothetical protein n=1 Tax=Helicobacter mustelae TaxID=217 RepID=UPI000DFAD2E9|nr:hypothetical protein [Helicobacter mustelae]STP12799.1 Uncharacterised protein [Helicobacter mustelae]